MSAPFAPGDVVVCVDDGPDPRANMAVSGTRYLKRGHFYRIELCVLTIVNVWGVQLIGDPSTRDGAWAADRFRKIDDEVTEDFRTQLKSISKPKERV